MDAFCGYSPWAYQTYVNEKETKDQYEKYTPLHIAARWQDKEVFQLLVSKGADTSIPNQEGKTACQLYAGPILGCPDNH